MSGDYSSLPSYKLSVTLATGVIIIIQCKIQKNDKNSFAIMTVRLLIVKEKIHRIISEGLANR